MIKVVHDEMDFNMQDGIACFGENSSKISPLIMLLDMHKWRQDA
jgi:hypothetical protein